MGGWGERGAVKDLVDKILPAGRVHLLGGVSDAGKTRFIIPAMVSFARGLPFLGHASHPVPWAYVSGDRVLEEAHDTISSMGIDPVTIPIIPAFGKDNKSTPSAVMAAAADLTPPPQLLVIEGFHDLVPGKDTRHDVRTFLSNMAAYCLDSHAFPAGLTILGIVESPKLKPNERYRNPRQRISGVSSWGFHSSTVILIEEAAEDYSFETPGRTIWVCMKNAKRLKLAAEFNEKGQLKCL